MKITKLIPLYLKELKVLNRSYFTIRITKYNLLNFARFLETEQIHDIEELSLDLMEEYQQGLAFRLTGKGKLLALRTQEKFLSSAKGFTRFLKEKDYLVSDPGERIKLPKQPKRLPKVILSIAEVKQLLAAPDMRSNQGYRNRIILEILYDTAIRRLELANIKTIDLDLNAGYIRVQGKGNKDRVVPLSQRVCELTLNYVMAVRPFLLRGDDHGWLILNRWGGKMDPNGIWAVVKRCTYLAGIKKNVTTHSLRHHADSRIMPTSFSLFFHPNDIPMFFFSMPLVNSA